MKDEIINEGANWHSNNYLYIRWLTEFIEFFEVNEFLPQNPGKTM